MQGGLSTGHQARYYEAGSTLLGGPQFLATLQHKTVAKHEVAVKGPKVSFTRLLRAVAEATGHSTACLVLPGRRAILWRRARCWCMAHGSGVA